MSIDWSFIFSLEELQVNYNNDRSRYSFCSLRFDVILLFMLTDFMWPLNRDYTNPNLPSEQKGRLPHV